MSGRGLWRHVIGPAATAAAALALELLAALGLPVPIPSGLILLSVAYAAFVGGTPSGLLGAAIGLIYYLFELSEPVGAFRYDSAAAGRLVAFAVVAPALAVLVGTLRGKLERSLGEERRAREEAERAARRFQFLAEASRAMAEASSSLATIQAVADRSVGSFADLCVVDLAEGKEIRRVAAISSRPEQLGLVQQLRQCFAPAWHGVQPAAAVLRRGRTLLIPEMNDRALARYAPDEEHARLLRHLGISSILAVPLRARGRTLGVITFCCMDSKIRYGREDVVLAEELAARAALALSDSRSYEQMLHANRAKSDFLAAISHDFRTPLTAILLCAAHLRDERSGGLPEGAERQVERIENAGRQLLQLIDQLLDFSRLEADQGALSVSRVRLGLLMREVAEVIEPLAAEKGLSFILEPPDTGDEIETDATKVKQVLLNLLSNAVQYTEAGEVRFRGWIEQDTVRCEVRDTGPGIPEELLEEIFQPFWTAPAGRGPETAGAAGGTEPAYRGTGLGLSVARKLSRLLGGDVRVRSRPGQGSTFVASFSVSCRAAEPPALAPPARAAQRSGGRLPA